MRNLSSIAVVSGLSIFFCCATCCRAQTSDPTTPTPADPAANAKAAAQLEQAIAEAKQATAEAKLATAKAELGSITQPLPTGSGTATSLVVEGRILAYIAADQAATTIRQPGGLSPACFLQRLPSAGIVLAQEISVSKWRASGASDCPRRPADTRNSGGYSSFLRQIAESRGRGRRRSAARRRHRSFASADI
jgi:hypothetical protein